MKNDIAHNTLLNVNIPYLPLDEIKGTRITRLGLRVYRNELVRRDDPFGHPYFWIGGEAPTGVVEEGTDIGAMNDGYVSITPVHLDMTAHDLMTEVSTWGWD
jgi:5'-nucleotidase